MRTRKTPSERKQRLKLLERAGKEELPRFRLTPRDREIIRAVYEYRALTTHQIAQLLFSESAAGEPIKRGTLIAQRRLRPLFHHGFLYRQGQATQLGEAPKPLVYMLDQHGVPVVAELLDLDPEEVDWRLRDNKVLTGFLDHLLATNDFRIAATLAAKEQGFTIPTWWDESTLRSPQMKDTVTLVSPEGKREKTAVIPDGYFVLQAGEYLYHHFLEIDRRTVTVEASRWGARTWAKKVRGFIEYYQSGRYQKRYDTKSLRILIVTTGERRMANLKAVTEKVGGKGRFWFTTFDLVTPENILTEPIWQQASKEGTHRLVWE